MLLDGPERVSIVLFARRCWVGGTLDGYGMGVWRISMEGFAQQF